LTRFFAFLVFLKPICKERFFKVSNLSIGAANVRRFFLPASFTEKYFQTFFCLLEMPLHYLFQTLRTLCFVGVGKCTTAFAFVNIFKDFFSTFFDRLEKQSVAILVSPNGP